MMISFGKNGKNISFNAEMAKNFFSRLKGAMFRKKTCPILFIFPNSRIGKFWNLFTPLDLDLFFIDEEGLVFEKKTLKANSRKTITSSKKIKYALEAEMGELDLMGWKLLL